MGFSRVSFVALISCLYFALSTEAVYSTEKQTPTAGSEISQSSQELSVNRLRQYSRAITVKISAEESWGSGIIIDRKGQVYTVLTNAHVLLIGDDSQVQTADGNIYRGKSIKAVNFNRDDLALVSFNSSKNYAIASVAKSPLIVGDKTFAAGFPHQLNNWLFTSGKVDYILPKSFNGGYQVGYSNDILPGMSGGPVLNQYGELVAINGRHKFPWGNPFIFKDGSTPNPEIRAKFEQSSWAVPVQTFLQRVPQFAKDVITPPVQSSSPTLPVSEDPPTPQPCSGRF